MKFIKKLFSIAFFVYACILLGMFLFQKPLVYPGAYHFKTTMENSKTQSVDLSAADGTVIQIVKMKNDKKNDKAILIFHGNNDLATNKINDINPNLGWDIFAVEFRGFGKNQGTPSEEGFLEDAKTALGYLQHQGYKKIVYYGHSLGTGTAVDLCRVYKPTALILDAPFTSLADTAAEHYPFLPKFIIKFLLLDEYDSKATLSSIKLDNLLIMHGQADNVINYQESVELFKSAQAKNKTLKLYPAANHNNNSIYNKQDLKTFLDNL